MKLIDAVVGAALDRCGATPAPGSASRFASCRKPRRGFRESAPLSSPPPRPWPAWTCSGPLQPSPSLVFSEGRGSPSAAEQAQMQCNSRAGWLTGSPGRCMVRVKRKLAGGGGKTLSGPFCCGTPLRSFAPLPLPWLRVKGILSVGRGNNPREDGSLPVQRRMMIPGKG